VPIEIPPVDGVSVVDEVSGLSTPWNRFHKLFPDPGRRRTGGNVEMDQLTAVVTDEEDVQDPVVRGAHDQEIGCPDALELIREEGPPALAPGPRRLPPPVSADGAVLLTTIPSLSSSPRMRSVPQSRFSGEIRAMRSLTSRLESRAAESGA
jgi:hypothetical protein